jgi:hypothetical protein
MTNVPGKIAQKYALKRKRKLLVRDWFFFVVWYIRLKKILKGVYQKETLNNFLIFNSRYTQLFDAFIRNPEMTQKEMKDFLAERIDLKRDKLFELKVRLESATLNIYKD